MAEPLIEHKNRIIKDLVFDKRVRIGTVRV